MPPSDAEPQTLGTICPATVYALNMTTAQDLKTPACNVRPL